MVDKLAEAVLERINDAVEKIVEESAAVAAEERVRRVEAAAEAAEAAKDTFDKIELDIFDQLDTLKLKEYVAPPKVAVSLSDEIRELIKAEIASLIKEAVAEEVKGIKPRTIETKTIERVVEKSIPTPEKVIIKEKLDEAELQKTISRKIKKALDETGPLFVPAPPIIPNWSDKADGVVLSKSGKSTAVDRANGRQRWDLFGCLHRFKRDHGSELRRRQHVFG
jgi:hypothetical protein